jgi:hypothetical protein
LLRVDAVHAGLQRAARVHGERATLRAQCSSHLGTRTARPLGGSRPKSFPTTVAVRRLVSRAEHALCDGYRLASHSHRNAKSERRQCSAEEVCVCARACVYARVRWVCVWGGVGWGWGRGVLPPYGVAEWGCCGQCCEPRLRRGSATMPPPHRQPRAGHWQRSPHDREAMSPAPPCRLLCRHPPASRSEQGPHCQPE